MVEARTVVPSVRAWLGGVGPWPTLESSPNDGGLVVPEDRTEPPTDELLRAKSLTVPGIGSFRKGSPLGGRMTGIVAVVTGAAQGFGQGIAERLAESGAWVTLADRNLAGAAATAATICARHRDGRAVGIEMDVTDPASVERAVDEVVARFGGIDLLVSNAGVLRAGSVYEQDENEFDLVTRVNYQGFFHVVKRVAPIMAAQHAVAPGRWFDIVQINSKSGLQGSNRNAAYAGSKFGGIGLTQSFAMELVSDGIKVNAICPGNYFEGPLWSDPEDGLFAQYLRTGKVPGAQCIADVRRFYESKVPMGRGCTVDDVMRALFYLIEQNYETGQALPVTGGQVMLR
ncbi:MAG: SDR family NAD(P)-dependent oxidoreductase [Fimbriimonadaceae bacterium]|nr:SDR family NAD(P)-dependent oxidoreductase [Fimbriimonadaceae bacterium]